MNFNDVDALLTRSLSHVLLLIPSSNSIDRVTTSTRSAMSSSVSSSPVPATQDSFHGPQTCQKRPIADVISETFPPFNHRTTIVEPFDNESKRDAEFIESTYMRHR